MCYLHTQQARQKSNKTLNFRLLFHFKQMAQRWGTIVGHHPADKHVHYGFSDGDFFSERYGNH